MENEQQDLQENAQQYRDQQLAFDAFRDFARGRIASHLLERDGLRFTHSTVQLVFEAFCSGQARTVGQQLYASIKESSKYHSQNKLAKQQGYGHPFPVRFQAVSDAYVIKGGPGGQYRLEDVELYVTHTGEPHRVF
jgi:hypothetical protein